RRYLAFADVAGLGRDGERTLSVRAVQVRGPLRRRGVVREDAAAGVQAAGLADDILPGVADRLGRRDARRVGAHHLLDRVRAEQADVEAAAAAELLAIARREIDRLRPERLRVLLRR